MRADTCSSVDDIILHLVGSLTELDVEVRIGDWEQVLGFRRAMMITSVWRNQTTGVYGMHCCDDLFDPTITPFNIVTSQSLHELLHDSAVFYGRRWGIVEKPISS